MRNGRLYIPLLYFILRGGRDIRSKISRFWTNRKGTVFLKKLGIFVCRMDFYICPLYCIDKNPNIHTCLFFIRQNFVVNTNICHLVWPCPKVFTSWNPFKFPCCAALWGIWQWKRSCWHTKYYFSVLTAYRTVYAAWKWETFQQVGFISGFFQGRRIFI